MSTPSGQPGSVKRSSFVSSDEAEITDFISRTYAENSSRFAAIRAGARFSARTNDVPDVGADRLRTSIDYSGSADGFEDFVFFLVRAGSVSIDSSVGSASVRQGDVAFYPLGVRIDFDMRGYDVTTMRLPRWRIDRVAEELTGTRPTELTFHGITPVSPSMHRYWRALLGQVSGALMDPDSPMAAPLLADNLAHTVAVAALHTFPNSAMTRPHPAGPGSVAPAAIRRAAAYVDAHAHLPVQLSDIAEAAGTSARALQYGFRRHLGATPLGYLQRVRLESARRDLQRADPSRGDTVAAVAQRWGFAHQGRFAAAYRAAYGVPPVHTLRE